MSHELWTGMGAGDDDPYEIVDLHGQDLEMFKEKFRSLMLSAHDMGNFMPSGSIQDEYFKSVSILLDMAKSAFCTAGVPKAEIVDEESNV